MKLINANALKEKIFDMPVPENASKHDVLQVLYKVTNMIDEEVKLYERNCAK